MKPATILAWFRQLAARKYDSPEARQGRPPKPKDVRKLVVEMALANPGLGVHQDQGRAAHRTCRRDRSHHGGEHPGRGWVEVTRENQVAGHFPHYSILDILFVETTGGDLTVKVENNTETGRGIFAEPVADANQTLDDARIFYAPIGADEARPGLVLLKISPPWPPGPRRR